MEKKKIKWMEKSLKIRRVDLKSSIEPDEKRTKTNCVSSHGMNGIFSSTGVRWDCPTVARACTVKSSHIKMLQKRGFNGKVLLDGDLLSVCFIYCAGVIWKLCCLFRMSPKILDCFIVQTVLLKLIYLFIPTKKLMTSPSINKSNLKILEWYVQFVV